MKKWILPLTIAAGILTLSACSGGSNTVVKSDAGNITKDELYDAMKERVGQPVLQELLYSKVLADKYEVTDKDVNAKLKEYKNQYGQNFQMMLLQSGFKDEKSFKETLKTQLLMEKAVEKNITDKDLKKYYDKEYKPEIRASHILVKDEKTAKEVKAKLNAGEDFNTLVKKYSTDEASVKNNGDLGWFGPGAMLPEFEKAAYALDVNAISEPVKSQYGYHIIKVTGKKEKEPFNKVKDKMKEQLKTAKLNDAQAVQKTIDKEMKDANVEIKDKDLQGILGKKEAK